MLVLFDTNIILDLALKRKDFFEDAFNLFKLIDQSKINDWVTASTITDIYYVSKKEKSHIETISFLKDLIEIVGVIGVDREIILKALFSEFKDFEDAIQSIAARINKIDVIITRNKKDFKDSLPRAFTPKEFFQEYNLIA
jgi:predicted nucleic acid-binding protein